MTRNHSTLAILALVCLLPSCAVPPPQVSDYPGDFRGVEAAPASQSRIYLFRPAFSFTERKQDTPTCSIDGSVALMLAHGTFTSLSLPPGRHVLSLVPGDRDAPLWRSDFEFNVDAGRVYFVAVWLDLEIREQRQFKLMPLLLPTARAAWHSFRSQLLAREPRSMPATFVLKSCQKTTRDSPFTEHATSQPGKTPLRARISRVGFRGARSPLPDVR
jgi:hypothetical protein